VFDPDRPIPKTVERAAEVLGFPIKKRVFKEGMLDEVVEMVTACGFPNDAINHVHRTAVETLASEYQVVGDGTRFNDRVPMLTRAEVQSLGHRTGCSYVRPEIDRLVNRLFVVKYGETGTIENGDYESEIREAFRARGLDCASLFPAHHDQSLVVGRKQ
jgi:tRNA methyltransferase